MMSETKSSKTAFFTSAQIRQVVPEYYRTWVRVGIIVEIVAYSIGLAATLKGHSLFARQELYAILCGVVALILARRGRPYQAACLIIGAMWCEMLFSSVVSPYGMRVSSISVFAALVTGSALLLGMRASWFIAAGSSVLVPFMVYVGGRIGTGPGLVSGDMVCITSLLASLLGTCVIIDAIIRSFSLLLERSLRSEKRVVELQSQLEHAQRVEMVGQLAAGITHDVNNMFAAIAGVGALLSNDQDPAKQELGKILTEAQLRGRTLTRKLLIFSRRETANPGKIDLGRVLLDFSGFLEHIVGDKVSVSINADGPSPIIADPGQVELVALNLASNARDAMPDGGVLEIRCGATTSHVRMTFRDTGAGMTPETVSRLFEPFFTTKPPEKGTGLGLATVHNIVINSGGTIEVQSEVGRGTTFMICWPRAGES